MCLVGQVQVDSRGHWFLCTMLYDDKLYINRRFGKQYVCDWCVLWAFLACLCVYYRNAFIAIAGMELERKSDREGSDDDKLFSEDHEHDLNTAHHT